MSQVQCQHCHFHFASISLSFAAFFSPSQSSTFVSQFACTRFCGRFLSSIAIFDSFILWLLSFFFTQRALTSATLASTKCCFQSMCLWSATISSINFFNFRTHSILFALAGVRRQQICSQHGLGRAC